MTRLAWLAAAPLLIVGALLMVIFFTGVPHGIVMHGAAIVAYSISMLSGVMAARRFGATQRVGRAWLLMATASGLGLFQAIVFGVAFHTNGAAGPNALLAILRICGVFLLNAAAVSGLVLFARVWNDTGLVPAWRRTATVVSIIAALAIAGRATVGDVATVVHAQSLAASGSLISDLGDILGITFMGPVLATAIAMRGGLLVWPWALLFCNSFSWLLYDAGGRLPPTWRLTTDFSLSLLAQLFLAAAAIAHVRVMAAARGDTEIDA